MPHTAVLRIVGSNEKTEGVFRNLRLLYVLSGAASAASGRRNWHLQAGDYLAVNPSEYATLQLTEEGLLGVVEFDADTARASLDIQKMEVT